MSYNSSNFLDVLAPMTIGCLITTLFLSGLTTTRNYNIEKELAPFEDTVLCSMDGQAYHLKMHKIADTHSYLVPTRYEKIDDLCGKTETGVEFQSRLNILKSETTTTN